jgi:hypothetical protein
MEPQRNTKATLVDLLDRVLDKGLVIHADLIVSVAGVPLIGVNLKAAIAGMETMLKYGMLKEDDARIRAYEAKKRTIQNQSIFSGEKILLKMLGAYCSKDGLYKSFRYGHIYLTEERILLYHHPFESVIFEAPLKKIDKMALSSKQNADNENEIFLLMENKEVECLKSKNISRLQKAIKEQAAKIGHELKDTFNINIFNDLFYSLLDKDEKIIALDNLWFLKDSSVGFTNTWCPGILFLTDKRLCFFSSFEKKIIFEILTEEIMGSFLSTDNNDITLKNKKVLNVQHELDESKRSAQFTGSVEKVSLIEKWNLILNTVIHNQGIAIINT